jgi:hypothetical protein
MRSRGIVPAFKDADQVRSEHTETVLDRENLLAALSRAR